MQCPWPPRHEPPPPLEVEEYWAGCAGQGGADPHPDNRRSARPSGPWRSSTPLTRPPRLPAPLLRPPQLEYSIPGVLGQEIWWQKKKNQNHVRGLFVVQTTSKQQLKTNLDPPPRARVNLRDAAGAAPQRPGGDVVSPPFLC